MRWKAVPVIVILVSGGLLIASLLRPDLAFPLLVAALLVIVAAASVVGRAAKTRHVQQASPITERAVLAIGFLVILLVILTAPVLSVVYWGVPVGEAIGLAVMLATLEVGSFLWAARRKRRSRAL